MKFNTEECKQALRKFKTNGDIEELAVKILMNPDVEHDILGYMNGQLIDLAISIDHIVDELGIELPKPAEYVRKSFINGENYRTKKVLATNKMLANEYPAEFLFCSLSTLWTIGLQEGLISQETFEQAKEYWSGTWNQIPLYHK